MGVVGGQGATELWDLALDVVVPKSGFAVCLDEHCQQKTRSSLVAMFLYLRCDSPAIRVGWRQVEWLRNAACSGADESRAEFTLAFL